MKVVALNVSSIPIAQAVELVLETNAKIHVQELAVKMLTVK